MMYATDNSLLESYAKKPRNFRICFILSAEYTNIMRLIHQKQLSVCNAIERSLKAFPASISQLCMLGEDFSKAVFKLVKGDEGVDDGKPLLVTECYLYFFYSVLKVFLWCNLTAVSFYMPTLLK